ncbi:MAG: tRNA guanosine(34) transglycosylase Tgt [bacterium]
MTSKFLELQLPIFMPDATLGVVRALTTEQVENTGTKMIVVNTYHLLITMGEKGMRKVGGIKKFMNWKGKVLSDSGGFQVFSLIHEKNNLGKVTPNGAIFRSPIDGSKHSLTPQISIDMQIAIGSDVLIALDDCRSEDVSYEDAKQSVENTIRWAKVSKKYLNNKYPKQSERVKLFAVVQGGNHKELRKHCAEELIKIGFDGYCFGGWPVDNRGRLVSDILEYVASIIPDDKAKYAMGVGTPDDIKKCFKMGYNMFDCVIPTRNARHGLLYTSKGEIRIQKSKFKYDSSAPDSKCECYTCSNFTKAYLHHLFKSKEMASYSLATIHNLQYYSDLMKSLV